MFLLFLIRSNVLASSFLLYRAWALVDGEGTYNEPCRFKSPPMEVSCEPLLETEELRQAFLVYGFQEHLQLKLPLRALCIFQIIHVTNGFLWGMLTKSSTLYSRSQHDCKEWAWLSDYSPKMAAGHYDFNQLTCKWSNSFPLCLLTSMEAAERESFAMPTRRSYSYQHSSAELFLSHPQWGTMP